jgi:predicted DCC family thiol-disulfide oxidoreductase YuxK
MTPAFPLTLYVDLDCPLCAREVRWLHEHANHDQLIFVDISADTFDERSVGRARDELNRRLHARSADGQWLVGIDATLWSWRAAGVGGWVAPLGWKPLRPVFNVLYALFARFRPHLAWLPHPDGNRCSTRGCAPDAQRKRPRDAE